MLFLKCFIKIKDFDIVSFRKDFNKNFKEKNNLEIENYDFNIKYKKDFDSFSNCILEFHFNGDLDTIIFDDANNDIQNLRQFSNNILLSIDAIDSVKKIYRFYDYSIFKELESFYPALFEIEMRVREFFSFILIELDNDFSDEFLKDSNVSSKEAINIPSMKINFENDLFHLTYGEYQRMNNFSRPLKSLMPLVGEVYKIRKSFSFDNLIDLLKTMNAKMHLKPHKEKIKNITTNLNEINKIRKKIAHMRALDYSDLESDKDEFNFESYIRNINDEIDALYSAYEIPIVEDKPIVAYAHIHLEKDSPSNLYRQNSSTIEFEDGTEKDIDIGDDTVNEEGTDNIEKEAKNMLRNYLESDYDVDGLDDDLIEIHYM